MKKLLVLALVLSMATMANATLTLTISGVTEVQPGSVTTYIVGYSVTAGEQIVSADQDITASAGAVGGAAFITTNRDTVLDIIQTNPITGNYQVAITNDILGTDIGSPMFSFQFTAPMQTGPVSLMLIDNGAMSDITWSPVTPEVQGLVVNVIPEPMTLGLLALGGLFIRRK